MSWDPDDLRALAAAEELEIAPDRVDGGPRRWLPIWVVAVGGEVFVRTWHRRSTGWFGDAVATGRAGVRVPGLDAEVTVEDVGARTSRADVDAAYEEKYGRHGRSTVERMTADEAAATTLRLTRVED